MQLDKYRERYHSTLLCVDRFDQQILCGRLINPSLSEPIQFDSTIQFLYAMEDILNKLDFPRPFVIPRPFSDVPQPQHFTLCGDTRQCGRLATFSIQVLFRQNASWQGSLTWLEDGRKEQFRSVFELLMLLNSALSLNAQQPAEVPQG